MDCHIKLLSLQYLIYKRREQNDFHFIFYKNIYISLCIYIGLKLISEIISILLNSILVTNINNSSENPFSSSARWNKDKWISNGVVHWAWQLLACRLLLFKQRIGLPCGELGVSNGLTDGIHLWLIAWPGGTRSSGSGRTSTRASQASSHPPPIN